MELNTKLFVVFKVAGNESKVKIQGLTMVDLIWWTGNEKYRREGLNMGTERV